MRRGPRLLCSAVLALLGGLPLSSTEIPIDGRVRDSGDVGLAGARVELRPILSSFEQGLRELDGKAVVPAARTVTDADGRFALVAPGEGMWEVVVLAEGYVPQRFRLTPLTGAETLFPVRLRRDAGLRVRVEGPDGRPLTGAHVVGRSRREEEPGWQTIPRVAVSGADGVARLSCSRDENLALLATAPGFPVQEGPEAWGAAEVIFRLAPGTPRKVAAPADAIVRDLQTSLVLGRGGAEVVTRGESWLLLETRDGIQVRFAIPEKRGAVKVEVPAPAPLPGKVIDSAARQPVAGAWIWPRHDPGRFVRSDGQGAYSLQGDDLEVAAAGHLPEIVDRSILWPEGGLPTVALDPEVFVGGTVEDAEGNPAAGAEVAVFAEEHSWFPDSLAPRPARVGRVSAQGKVRIGGLRHGSGVQLLITGSGFAPAWLNQGWLEARDNRIMVVLARGGRVQGRVEDREGRPVPDAQVKIAPAPGMPGVWRASDPADEGERLAFTGPDGGFAFADLPPGWYETTVRRPGAAAQRLPRFEMKEGGTADLGALRLEDAEVLPVRVIDSAGRPVAGAEVWISVLSHHAEVGPGLWPVAASGADGGFSLRASRWHTLGLTVCAPGFIPLDVTLPRFLPDEPLVLTVQPGATVSGRYTDADGFPVAGSVISVDLVGESAVPYSRECNGRRWNETDAAGRFRATGMEPGLYVVDFGKRVVVAAGESRELAVSEGRARVRRAAFSGKLLGRDGLPIPGAVISLAADEQRVGYMSQDLASSHTDGDGNYRLEFRKPGLKVASMTFGVSRHGRALMSGFPSWPGPAVLEEDGRVDIPIESFPFPLPRETAIALEDYRGGPEPLTTITGRIFGLEPEELARVRVSAGRLGYPSMWTGGSVDAQGSYRLEGLTQEKWWIRAEAADRTFFEAVHLPAGEARIVRDLIFPPVGEVHGSIETPDQEPVAGAAVRLRHYPRAPETQWPDVEVRTGSDGGYQVRLPVGDYEITAAKEGFVPSPEAPVNAASVEEGKEDDANLWLQPAVELRGRLTGLPPDESEIKIEATLLDGLPGYKPPRKGKMVAADRYAIPGLGPGTWEVEAVCDPIGTDELKAIGKVVISEEAGEAVLDLALRKYTD